MERPSVHKTKYTDESKSFLLCKNCKALNAIDDADKDKITELGIYDRSCKIPSSLLDLINLKELSIFAQKVRLPDGKDGLENLEVFNAYDSHLPSIPAFVYQCKQLTRMVVGLTDGNSIDENISNLQKLEHLTLAFQNLDSLESGIFELRNLRELVVRTDDGTRISLAENIVELEQLTLLEMPIDVSTHIDLLAQLTNLKKLVVPGIACSNGDYSHLERINFLEEIHVQELPDDLDGIKSHLKNINVVQAN